MFIALVYLLIHKNKKCIRYNLNKKNYGND